MLQFFNHEMEQAALFLRKSVASDGLGRVVFLVCATQSVRDALREANRMRDRKRAGLCLRILHWLRAAEREA